VLLVDAGSGLPVDRADEVATTAADAVAELTELRGVLLAACGDGTLPIAAAVHPHVSTANVGDAGRSGRLVAEYGDVIRRQLVGALQVHVAVGDADATVAVHDALRGHLPELAALAAAAPFQDGRDTGLASVRPLVAGQLPRQGVPPPLGRWDAFVTELRWGAASGGVAEPGRWWWELRPNVRCGTLEVRVPDVQPTIAAALAVATTVQALVVDLAARHRGGEALGAPPSWRIAENRWSALRDGVHGHLADLETGEARPTRDLLLALLDRIEDQAGDLDGARALAERNAADELRAAGPEGAVAWLAGAFSA
jgi:carboxylate-amine ligase